MLQIGFRVDVNLVFWCFHYIVIFAQIKVYV